MASRGPFVDLGSWGHGFIAGISFVMVVCLVTFTIKMSHYFSCKISVSQDLDPEGRTLDWTVLEIRVGDCFHFYSLALLKIKNDRKPGYRKAMSQGVGVLCCFLLNVMRTRAPRAVVTDCWPTIQNDQIWRDWNEGLPDFYCISCWNSHTRTQK